MKHIPKFKVKKGFWVKKGDERICTKIGEVVELGDRSIILSLLGSDGVIPLDIADGDRWRCIRTTQFFESPDSKTPVAMNGGEIVELSRATAIKLLVERSIKPFDDYCQQLVAEQLITKPTGKKIWIKTHKANHYLDAEKYGFAAAYILNVNMMRKKIPVKKASQDKKAINKNRITNKNRGNWMGGWQ